VLVTGVTAKLITSTPDADAVPLWFKPFIEYDI